MLIQTEIHPGILYGVKHHMFQFSGIDIRHSHHEIEVHLLLRHEGTMAKDTLVKIGEVERYTLSLEHYGHLDVSEEHA